MKVISNFAISMVVIVLAIWAFGAFICLEPNPLAWTREGRLAAVFLAIASAPFARLVALELSE